MRAVGGSVFRVVHAPFVVVRDTPSLHGAILGGKREGEYVLVKSVEEGTPWAQLDREHEGFEKEAWMLLHGAQVGLGPLLEPVDANSF